MEAEDPISSADGFVGSRPNPAALLHRLRSLSPGDQRKAVETKQTTHSSGEKRVFINQQGVEEQSPGSPLSHAHSTHLGGGGNRGHS